MDIDPKKTYSKEDIIELASTGRYLFHGSGQDLSGLKPQKPKTSYTRDFSKFKDEPFGVFATPYPEYAIFMALNSGSSGRSYVHWDDGVFKYGMSPRMWENLKDTAFLYVVDKLEFVKRNSVEYVCENSVKPLLKIVIDKSMMPKKIEAIDDPTQGEVS